jgi:hypothetical protein
VSEKIHCMLCGKEWLHPDPAPCQEFYLCADCTKFWLADYLRRLKSRVAGWLRWI